MKERKDEAFVLTTREIGETDLIVSLLAQRRGKVRGVARGARKSRKRFGGLLEPMTRVRAVWVEKEGRELHRIDSLDGLRSFAAMQADPLLQAACAVLAEVGETFASEGEADPRGFKLLGASLEALEEERDPLLVVRYFEYWTLLLHGLLPDVSTCSVCSRTLPEAEAPQVGREGVVCRDCLSGTGRLVRRLGRAERDFMEQARRRPPGALTVPRRVARPGGVLETLLRGTLENFAERRFRTYRHLAAANEPTGGEGRER